MIVDIFYSWSLHTAEIEGTNNRLKSLIRRSPFIGWKTLSDELTNAAIVRDLNDDELKIMESTCVEWDARVKTMQVDTEEISRYGILVDKDTPAAPLVSAAAAQAIQGPTRESKVAATMITRMKSCCGWGVAAKHETPAGRGLLIHLSSTERRFWLLNYRFGYATYVYALSDAGDNTVVLARPFDIKLLLHVVADGINEGQIEIESITLRWENMSKASWNRTEGVEIMKSNQLLKRRRRQPAADADAADAIPLEDGPLEDATEVVSAEFFAAEQDDYLFRDDDFEDDVDLEHHGNLPVHVSDEASKCQVKMGAVDDLGIDPSSFAEEKIEELKATITLYEQIGTDTKHLVQEKVMSDAEDEVELVTVAVGVQKYLQSWAAKLKVLRQDLAFMKNLPDLPENSHLSLVALETVAGNCSEVSKAALWIHWDDVSSYSGRVTRLENSSIVYKGPGVDRCNVQSFADDFSASRAWYLIPNCGHNNRMVRQKGFLRTELAPEIVRTAKRLNTDLLEDCEPADSDSDNDKDNACGLCKRCEGQIMICKICEQSIHRHCSNTVNDVFAKAAEQLFADAKSHAERMPDVDTLLRDGQADYDSLPASAIAKARGCECGLCILARSHAFEELV